MKEIMKIKCNIISIIITSFVIFSFFNTICLAGGLQNAFQSGDGNITKQMANKAEYQTDGSKVSFTILVGKAVQTVLNLIGVMFLVLSVYGGYTWMTAQGNEAKVEKAQSMITASIVGLIIVLSAYAISYFVMSNIASKTLAP